MSHYYTPYPGQLSAENYVEFYKHESVLFENELPDLYSWKEKLMIFLSIHELECGPIFIHSTNLHIYKVNMKPKRADFISGDIGSELRGFLNP